MSGEAVIDVRGLTKRFGTKTVVDHVDLKVPRGAIYGFLGPNGSGKTTTIRMVCGLLRPDAGEGQVLGYDVVRDSAHIKARTGYMTQKFSLYEDLSIAENLSFVARLFDVEDRARRVEEAIEDLGLTARAKQLAGTLSGGWKQRVALAACMIHDPDLLLLDEPTAGVDPKARRDFWDQIRRYAARGVTTLVSTHYMDEAVQCDSIAYIAYGKKLIDAPTRDIPKSVGLNAFDVTADDVDGAADALRGREGVELVARFGESLHVAGTDKAKLETAIRSIAAMPGFAMRPIEAGLEEAFIHLMSQSADNMT
ncbi:MAG: ABC transporter ATP-binding protein [Micropepsaceae bacterium]